MRWKGTEGVWERQSDERLIYRYLGIDAMIIIRVINQHMGN
jgi:hypothetical protein